MVLVVQDHRNEVLDIFSPAKPRCETLFLGSVWKGFQTQAEVSGTKVLSLCAAVGDMELALERAGCPAV